MANQISVRAFAKIIGVSHMAVTRAVKDGKFTKGWDADSKKIDDVVALEDEWVKSVRIVKKNGISKAKFIEKTEKQKAKVVQATSKQTTTESKQTTVTKQEYAESDLLRNLKITAKMDMAEAMKVNEIISAELARLKLLETEKVLVRKVDVEKVLFAFGSQLKKSITKLPEMIVDEELASGNKVVAINIIKEAINEILNSYANFSEITINE